jgi:hypothetical protein
MRNAFVRRIGTAAAVACLAAGCGTAPQPAEQSGPAAPAEAPGERGSPEQLKALASRPTPHLPDGRPDLNATWDHLGGIEFVRIRDKAPAEDESVCVFGCAPPPGQAGGAPAGPPPQGPPGPGFPNYKPEFAAKVKELKDRQVQMDTVLQCAPPGVPRIGPPAKIIQNAREVVFLYDDVNGPYFRIIPTDGRPHRTDLEPSYLGDAIGRYEGDTLIVETRNLNDETWLTDDGAFHTTKLKVVERLQRVGDTILYEAVAEDPDVLSEPFALKPMTLWVSTEELAEPARCDDRDLAHMVDGSYHSNPR